MKYEYKILSIKKRDNSDWYNHSLDLVKNLNLAGYDGWRLVTVSDGIAYFERPIKEQVVNNVYVNGIPLKQVYDD